MHEMTQLMLELGRDGMICSAAGCGSFRSLRIRAHFRFSSSLDLHLDYGIGTHACYINHVSRQGIGILLNKVRRIVRHLSGIMLNGKFRRLVKLLANQMTASPCSHS